MSDLCETRQFAVSHGKVRELDCPYRGDAEVVELTATDYMLSQRCLCSFCWKLAAHRATRFVRAWRWGADDE